MGEVRVKKMYFGRCKSFKKYILVKVRVKKKHILVEVTVKKMCFGRGQSLKNIFWARSEFKIIYFGRGQS